MTGTILLRITNDKIDSMDFTEVNPDLPKLSNFDQLMILRKIAVENLDSFEKENQKLYVQEAKAAPKYEEKF